MCWANGGGEGRAGICGTKGRREIVEGRAGICGENGGGEVDRVWGGGNRTEWVEERVEVWSGKGTDGYAEGA